jgi:hypothetical protein
MSQAGEIKNNIGNQGKNVRNENERIIGPYMTIGESQCHRKRNQLWLKRSRPPQDLARESYPITVMEVNECAMLTTGINSLQ